MLVSLFIIGGCSDKKLDNESKEYANDYLYIYGKLWLYWEKVIPFNTHEESGNAGTHNTIKTKLKEANVNTNGLALQGNIARTDEGKKQTINWLKKIRILGGKNER